MARWKDMVTSDFDAPIAKSEEEVQDEGAEGARLDSNRRNFTIASILIVSIATARVKRLFQPCAERNCERMSLVFCV